MAKKTLSITLYMSELLYELQDSTYLTGMSRKNGSNDEEVAHMMVNMDDECKNQLLRSIQSAYGEIKNQLAEYISDDKMEATDELISSESNLNLILSMPSNYNLATRESVTAGVHDYIINYSIAKWFIITNKEDSKDYFTLATNDIVRIKQAINKRTRPERPEVNGTA